VAAAASSLLGSWSSSSCTAPPPPSLPLSGAVAADREQGCGWLGLRVATSGAFMGDPRARGAGSDAEGGDARRPCHGHAARIRRLRRGVRVWRQGGRGAGKKGRARAGGHAGCHGAERRAGWRMTRGCGAAAGKRGKERQAVGASVAKRDGAAEASGRERAGVAGGREEGGS
jgi:hypothetical protein